jgi:hypothetical protein
MTLKGRRFTKVDRHPCLAYRFMSQVERGARATYFKASSRMCVSPHREGSLRVCSPNSRKLVAQNFSSTNSGADFFFHGVLLQSLASSGKSFTWILGSRYLLPSRGSTAIQTPPRIMRREQAEAAIVHTWFFLQELDRGRGSASFNSPLPLGRYKRARGGRGCPAKAQEVGRRDEQEASRVDVEAEPISGVLAIVESSYR